MLSRAESMPIQRTSAQSSSTAGPRTQCDQIIYEAIVKACEIVVRGRCDETLLEPHDNSNSNGRRLQRQHSELLPRPTRSNYGSSISQQQQQQQLQNQQQQEGMNSRFNLEIREVGAIRQILSTWKTSLHLPLRLDIYHQTTEGGQTQRELLERYCFNYTLQNNSQMISLRSVCKRIVCWMRSLHCLLRMLPAQNHMCGHTSNVASVGQVGYSIYTTDQVDTLPSPSFALKSLPSIMTGFGSLSLSIMYDATLTMRSEPIPILGGQQQIIKDYHSPPLQAENGEKRVMSGLSLVMMDQDENFLETEQHQQHYQHQVGQYIEENDVAEESLLPWGSPATRAAFHLPPAYADGARNEYGYGYIGAQLDTVEPEPQIIGRGDNLSISPSPLMSTPPQTMWGKPRKGEVPTTTNQSDENMVSKPFTNPTSLQPTPSRSASQSASAHANSMSNSPQPHSFDKSDEQQQPSQRKRTSSSSILPPVTSLDLLQKSPFSTKMAADVSGIERVDGDGIPIPFILESYRDEMLTSSIPRMISAGSGVRNSSIGGGLSGNSLLAFGNLGISGGFHSTGPYAARSVGGQYSHSNVDADEMPFAVDDDFPLVGSASNPFGVKSSKSLWGSAKGEATEGSMNAFSEAASSLAVSSLHQRCAVEGKPRLKLFENTHSLKLAKQNLDNEDSISNNDYATIKDQLSDLRSFGASLMVGSVHDSCSE